MHAAFSQEQGNKRQKGSRVGGTRAENPFKGEGPRDAHDHIDGGRNENHDHDRRENDSGKQKTIAQHAGRDAKTRPGIGSTYLGGYRDKDNDWLDGGRSYRLRVPDGVPAKRFWSVTVYHNDTRYLIQNKQKIADRSSRMNLLKNDDGSVDIYFGPTAPKGKEQNWIPTNPGEGWFSYFRIYGPLEAYFDRSWVLPDIERIGRLN